MYVDQEWYESQDYDVESNDALDESEKMCSTGVIKTVDRIW